MADPFPYPSRRLPSLTFQLRASATGGVLLESVWQIPTLDPFARREAVVLVHGYNNSFGDAATAFDAFRTRQYGNCEVDIPGLEAFLVDTFWPGDAGGVLQDFYYATDLATAKDAVPIIASHIGDSTRLPNLQVVHFIGHSMGCRIVLEVIKLLMVKPGPQIGKVCLMAAAVPGIDVAPGGSLSEAMAAPQQVNVLYSVADTVLRKYFKLGQWRAYTTGQTHEDYSSDALGRSPPKLPANARSILIDQADHSDYWPSQDPPNEVATAQANLEVSVFFGFDGMQSRGVAARTAAPTGAPAEGRPVGDARSTGSDRSI